MVPAEAVVGQVLRALILQGVTQGQVREAPVLHHQ